MCIRDRRGEETVEPPAPRSALAKPPRDPSRGTPLQWLGFLIAVAVVVGIVLVKLSGMQAPVDPDSTIAPDVEPVRGGTLRVGTVGALEGLDPIPSQVSGQPPVHTLVYDTLVELDPSGEPVPSLAQTWTVSNGYTRYELRIREGVRFHPDPCLPGEGHELEARDVRATLERVLLRISNLSVTKHFTLKVLGIPMTVVGRGSKILRGGGEPTGLDLAYRTTAVTLGGGEAMDVILETEGVASGTYFMYTSNLHYLSNGSEDFGGMMTEIEIN